jgi:hypothetical protein
VEVGLADADQQVADQDAEDDLTELRHGRLASAAAP